MAEFEIPRETSLNHVAVAISNSMVKIDDTHIILAYSGTTTSALKTFSLDSKTRVATELNILVHESANGTGDDGSLVFIDATHFALAYTGAAGDGVVKTFSIDGSFVITEIDSLEHDTLDSNHHSLILLDSTHLALAYRGVDGDGFVKTFSFNGTTFGSITELNSLEHDTVEATFPSMVKIDDTHFALAYSSDTQDGFVKTFSVDGSFVITQIDSLEHDATRGASSSMVLIDSTHLFLAYDGNFGPGIIKTISFDGSFGSLTVVDTLSRTGENGTFNSVVKIDATHFILAHTLPASDGGLATFSIDGSFVITEIDKHEHNTANGTYNSLVMIDPTHFVLAYTNGGPGDLKTFSIEPVATAADTGNAGMIVF